MASTNSIIASQRFGPVMVVPRGLRFEDVAANAEFGEAERRRRLESKEFETKLFNVELNLNCKLTVCQRLVDVVFNGVPLVWEGNALRNVVEG
jgi:hypothetical protein